MPLVSDRLAPAGVAAGRADVGGERLQELRSVVLDRPGRAQGTPPEAIARLNKALNVALADTQMRARAQVNGWELIGGAPKVLADTIVADMAEYPALIKQLDIKAN